jgi:hypothetical protein
MMHLEHEPLLIMVFVRSHNGDAMAAAGGSSSGLS